MVVPFFSTTRDQTVTKEVMQQLVKERLVCVFLWRKDDLYLVRIYDAKEGEDKDPDSCDTSVFPVGRGKIFLENWKLNKEILVNVLIVMWC